MTGIETKQHIQQRYQEQLEQAVILASRHVKEGKVASYIPELAKSDPNHLSAAVVLMDGSVIAAGNTQTRFTLQSIAKLFSLAIALADHGCEYVFSRVGMEPTGDPFNSIMKLEAIKPHKPLNPMINAGAIVVCDMVKGNGCEERTERILSLLRKMTGNPEICVNHAVYLSEKNSANRNRALAYFMKDSGVLTGDVEDTLDFYFRHCSIEVNTQDVAWMASVLAADGAHPVTGERLIDERIAGICKTFMVTCGMYNASGEFAIQVGIPAKSGVAGGIMATVPMQMGIGVYSPGLDEKGNSLAGVKLLQELSNLWNLSIF
ncbi:glutaminase A [Brevibacillus migulae]|uniref:glutaminase A n=1 Tax=Brevibacillus migulae TaxID=1644114 RepID=UPI00106E35CA|nr:glutaminase A [Brevibacillus migulae]